MSLLKNNLFKIHLSSEIFFLVSEILYLQFDFKPLCWCAISPFHAKWANYADEFIHFVPLEVSRCVIKSSIVGLLWWFQLPTLLYWIELWSILVFILPDWSKQFQSCFLAIATDVQCSFIHEDFIPVDLYQHHQVAPFQKYLTVKWLLLSHLEAKDQEWVGEASKM